MKDSHGRFITPLPRKSGVKAFGELRTLQEERINRLQRSLRIGNRAVSAGSMLTPNMAKQRRHSDPDSWARIMGQGVIKSDMARINRLRLLYVRCSCDLMGWTVQDFIQMIKTVRNYQDCAD